jgi:hypothetical protein
MTAPVNNKTSYALAQAMQRQWMEYAVWIREHTVAAVDERIDRAEVAARLLRVPTDIGRAVEKYHGRKAGRRVTQMLKQHVTIAIDFVDAACDGDRQRYNDVESVWDDNAADFATALGALNVTWTGARVRELWKAHIALIKAMLTARLEENFDHEVDTLDELMTTVVAFADAMTDGIIREFADKFAA